jgi:hypothetical protein
VSPQSCGQNRCGEAARNTQKSFQDLRGTDIARIDTTDAGERAQLANHVEKYHYEDTRRALTEFTASEDFYNEFPTRSKYAVGVPLAICGYFILPECPVNTAAFARDCACIAANL